MEKFEADSTQIDMAFQGIFGLIKGNHEDEKILL